MHHLTNCIKRRVHKARVNPLPFVYRMPSAQPPVENGAAPPKSELEELQIKANTVTDEVSIWRPVCNVQYNEPLQRMAYFPLTSYPPHPSNTCVQSLESTRRMLALCEEVSVSIACASPPFRESQRLGRGSGWWRVHKYRNNVACMCTVYIEWMYTFVSFVLAVCVYVCVYVRVCW